uniref:Uncharacterized protein n=1 Tax=Pseudo-nitzschia australis TaxID=44445 RepID=A0A7S4EPU8_9STRA
MLHACFVVFFYTCIATYRRTNSLTNSLINLTLSSRSYRIFCIPFHQSQILDTCLRYGSKDNMTAIVIQFPGCEKSYVDAAKAAPANKDVKDAEGSATTTATTTTTTTTTEGDKRQQEGVAGRRRKREEVHGVQHQQQQQQREEYGGGGGGDGGGGSGVESPSRAPL